ncbi:hypothetical protein [Magnetospira sp. QH-2]|uniref:Nmad2 family putative nucleotide modification protein n=1 Tax=Magnetospira sp. (strain QH-2) TaxID=1288970 RepID=UPI0011DE0B32|nr:hypothetical protein [Magnetospira sp. QH-2]
MTKIYRYILAYDNGMAPCVDNGLITLATCKPTIRRVAMAGDWVAGFFPSPHPRGLLSYVGKVKAIIDVGNYERKYRGRSDAVYRQEPDDTFTRLQPEYHPSPNHKRKDLSGPVLIFDPAASWYFGNQPNSLPENLQHLSPHGRGHRVNGAAEGDVIELEKWLRKNWEPGVHGKPRDISAFLKRGKSHC